MMLTRRVIRASRLPLVLAGACLALSLPAVTQAIDEAPIVIPEPDEGLFVDPFRDVLDPSRAFVRPGDAEIEPARFDVRPSEHELPERLARLDVGRLEPGPSLLLDPTADRSELRGVTHVGDRGANALLNRLARRATYDDLAASRRVRFARPER